MKQRQQVGTGDSGTNERSVVQSTHITFTGFKEGRSDPFLISRFQIQEKHELLLA